MQRLLIGVLSSNYVHTVITSDTNDLERQRISIEERRESLRKLEKHDLRAQ